MSGTTLRWSRRGLYFLFIMAFLWEEIECFVEPWVYYLDFKTHANLNPGFVTTFFVVPTLMAIAIFFDQVIVILFKLSLVWMALALWYAFSHGDCKGSGLLDGLVSCGMFIAQASLDLAIYNINCFVASFVRFIFHPYPEIIQTHLDGLKIALWSISLGMQGEN
jgi:hypothetical protein